MQWLVALETDGDPISICRLMNIFRRKGVRIVMLSLAAVETGFSFMALAETAESEVEHLFHFLRRSEAVEHVTCYMPCAELPSGTLAGETGSTYAFVSTERGPLQAAQAVQSFPGSKVIFSSEDKLLLEIPVESRSRLSSAGVSLLQGAEVLHLACAKTTRTAPVSELVA